MTATPKHRLRATVTTTLELDAPTAEQYPSGVRGLAAAVHRDIENGTEYLEDHRDAVTVVKVEVIR